MWFAYYLYRRNLVSARDLIEAIGRHHQSKTPIGKLAEDLGYLTADQVRQVLQYQLNSTAGFSEVAATLGFLTHEQSVELAGLHLRYTDNWNHLVKYDLLTEQELEFHLKQFHRECLERDRQPLTALDLPGYRQPGRQAEK